MLTSIAALTGKYYIFSSREMPSLKGFHLINIYNGSLTLFFSSPQAVLLSDGHLSNLGVENDGLGCGTLPAQAVPLMSLKSSVSLPLSPSFHIRPVLLNPWQTSNPHIIRHLDSLTLSVCPELTRLVALFHTFSLAWCSGSFSDMNSSFNVEIVGPARTKSTVISLWARTAWECLG